MSPNPLILPEVRWTWRRVFAFGRTLIYAALIGVVIWRLPTAAASAGKPLQWLGLALVATSTIDALLYMAGATVTDITRLTAAARSGQAPPGDLS
ncbi:hypothetical protein [Caulobacter sp. BP25]|uniref:hypothetical protein n=1 Tax=Caulobacter sp. BP25 TaxID=2048900 RepID=UPI001180947B|nr:hypothetical protein [Caulobacter sp. BP25]